MSSYQIHFTRYAKGVREISYPLFRSAESFRGAYELASLFMEGMREADPERTYEIMSIAAHGYSGETCSGPGLWQFRQSVEDSEA